MLLRLRQPFVRPEPGYRRLSLYSRVLMVNAGVLVAATAVLAFTPATVPVPVGLEQALVLVLGLATMVCANAILLRVTFAPLSRLVRLMRTIDLLKPGQRLGVSGGVEARQVIRTFNEMLERLELERQASTRRTLTAQESERSRIGQELHDEIGQRLTGILLQLQKAIARAPDDLRAELRDAQDLTRSTLDEVGQLAWRLRPGILDDLGLVRAIESLTSGLEALSGVRIEQELDATIAPLPPDAELAIFRVAQEALTNVLRHARASRVAVELCRSPNGVRLRVADDGQGLSRPEEEGAGIRGMRERALLVGAKLVVDARPGAGVTVELDVPARVDPQ
jgi:two-component system sensor histidine kinase UhpB